MEHLKALGRIVPLRDLDDGSDAIILRHDVDFDVVAAHRLASLEAERGVCSTYFFLMTGCTYNPLAPSNRALITAMASMGFEIGLHFDPTVYACADASELAQRVDEEAALLSSVVGQRIESVSLHNPTALGRFPLFDGYRNAYDPKLFSDESYLSDSCMRLRGKDPFAFVSNTSRRPLQILLHPLHYTDDGASYPGIMLGHFHRHVSVVDRMFRAANATYADEVAPGLFSHLLGREAR